MRGERIAAGICKAIVILAALQLGIEAATYAGKFLRSAMPDAAAGELLVSMAAFACATAPFVLAEALWPASTMKRDYWRGARFWALSLLAIFAWSKLGAALVAWTGLYPLLKIRLWRDSSATVIAAWIIGVMWAYDFFYYWLHRAQHRYPVLWRVHRVHHSIEHLNAVNCYHHVLEHALRIPFVTLPLAFFLTVDVPQLVLLSAFVSAWGQFIHADARISLGRLGMFVGDNAHHRIHHSTEPRHFDRNFAAFFPVWDWLFGTYCAPEPGAWPQVGLAELREPRSAAEYLNVLVRER